MMFYASLLLQAIVWRLFVKGQPILEVGIWVFQNDC